MFNNKKQLLCSNNLTLEMKRNLYKVVFGVLLFVDQKHDPRKKWREGRKCIWNMVLQKNFKNKVDG